MHANQITAVRVQFLPARQREGTQMTRALVGNLSFTEYVGKEKLSGGNGGSDSGSDGDQNENPLG